MLPANLTVPFGQEALTTADPGGWCQQRAASLLGARASGRVVRRLADSLEEHLGFFRSEMPLIAAAVCFYPDYATLPPRAMVTVQGFEGDSEKALTMDKARDFYGKPDEMSFGETELTESELPSGPAIRVHRYRKADPGKRRSTIIEEIVWLVWPPGWTFTIVMSVRWGQPVFAEAGAVIADEMAQNFRIESGN
jgi:hypothetical protein